MSKLSYKSLFIIFFFLLIGVVILSRFVLPNKKVSAAWWDEMWHYRKSISINNSSGSNQTNTQIKILDNYDLSALVTAGKIQSDLDDLRFTDVNGNLLSYWIEDSTNNSTDVWGILSSIPNGGTTIYMYYGNSSATAVSSTTNITIGGTMTSINGYRIHTFKGNGTLTNAKTENAEVLVVAGGGGGGSSTGAGGGGAGGAGAGGLVYNSSYSLTQDQTINVTVGIGGTNGTTSTNQSGTNGEDSIFGTITATGGGGGARTATNGNSGGSGGGAGYNQYTTVRYGGSGVVGVGNSGGNTSNLSYAGGAGGGGATDVGGDNKTGHVGGDGGLGISYSITGVGVTYATGGRGGGGAGAVSKTANTGNGGDGSYAAAVPTSGASGIVVVRYLSGTAATPTTEEFSPAPIAYWKFDEGIGTTSTDFSGNSNTGTITGCTWTSEDQCINGKCLNFNGSGSPNISIPTNNHLDFGTNNFTISAWALNRDYTYPKSNFMIKKSANCYADGASNSGFDIGHGYKSNGIDICLHDTSNNYSRQTLVFNNGYQPSQLINKWTHYVFIFDRTNNKIIAYINGVKQSNELNISSITDSINTTSALVVGTMYGWQTDGMYDEVKIYPYARTADQIKLDYNSRGSSKGTSVNLGIKSNTAPDLKSKLVAYWKFDENNGNTVYDSSGNNLNGSFFGAGSSGPNWTNDAKNNKALSFGGDIQSIFVPNSSSIGLTNNFTISTWVYPREYPSGGVFKVLMGKVNTWTNGYALGSNNGNFQILVTNGVGYTIASDTSNYSLNKWYFITTTYNNSILRFYVNGVLKDQQTVPTIVSSNNDFYIGGANGASNRGFNSIIDEVKIYNTVLTAEEVKQDYNQGSAVQMGSTNQTIGGTTTSLEYCIPGDISPCASPIAEWKMDEGVGASTVDISGNNFTGTISNATWSQGKIGKSLNFNGESSSAYISNQYPSSSPSSFTAEAWIKPNSINGTGERASYGYTIMAASADGSRYPVWITLRNGEIRASAFVGALAYTETVGANIQTNNWYHIAVSATQNSTATIYVNGIGKTSFTAGNIPWNTADKLTIGDLRPTRNISFNGSIDHVKIYNYARTPAQIAYDYNKGAPIGWWKFDECQGNIAYDWSGIGNTGVINIGASGTQNSLGTCQIGTSAAWTAGSTGKTNSSLNFDGVDDNVNISSLNNFFGNGSVAMWVKWTGSGFDYFFDHVGHDFLAFTISNGISFFPNYGADTTDRLNVTNITWDTNWHHIVFIANDSTNLLQIYLDGILKGSSSPDWSAATVNNLIIGADEAPIDFDFQGQIDDVRIYNYALTAEQIKVLYNGGAVKFN